MEISFDGLRKGLVEDFNELISELNLSWIEAQESDNDFDFKFSVDAHRIAELTDNMRMKIGFLCYAEGKNESFDALDSVDVDSFEL